MFDLFVIERLKLLIRIIIFGIFVHGSFLAKKNYQLTDEGTGAKNPYLRRTSPCNREMAVTF